MPLDFVDEKELSDLGNVTSNKPIFRVSPADQLHVQNKSKAFFFLLFKRKITLLTSYWKPALQDKFLLDAVSQDTTGQRCTDGVFSLIKRNTGKGHMQIYEK